jgi:hypothetical protein
VGVVAWTCSGEEEHGKKPPVAPAPGAGEAVAAFVVGPMNPSQRPDTSQTYL